MKGNLGILLLISLFLGFVLISVGIGMIFPSIFRISAPLVCNGTMEIETREYSYRPGEYSTQNTIYCLDGTTGERRTITLLTFIISSLIFSVIIFLLFCTNIMIKRLRGKKSVDPLSAANPLVSHHKIVASVPDMLSGEDPVESLKKLKELMTNNLITEKEYEIKKAEILSKI